MPALRISRGALEMNDKSPFTEVSKYFIRYLLQIPSFYRPSEKPHIFLFSTRRSGSTLLRDVIYSQAGFNFIDQPFDLTQYNWHTRHLPHAELSQFITLNSTDADRIEAYIYGLLNRKYIFRSQWQFWNGHYHWCWERYIVKILAAKALIHWFEEKFSNYTQFVFMTRHPIPTSLSIIKRKWGLATEAYLKNETFLSNNLSNRMVSFAWNILRLGSPLENHVLEWCLENLIPLRGWQNSNWVTISYENLIANPHTSVQKLCEKLDLNEPEKMLTTLNIPTRTALQESKTKIISDGAQARLDAWQHQVSSEEIRQVNTILDHFEIDLYKAHEPMPQTSFDVY